MRTIQNRRILIALAICLIASVAQGQPSPRLSDGWLDHLADAPQVAWSHAFALREHKVGELDVQRRRLVGELDTLIASARLSNAEAQGLSAWRQRLADDDSLPARTPGRFGLPWLGAHPRQDLPLTSVALWGSCKPPAWVEIWHLGGITRLPWRQSQSLESALAQLESQVGETARAGVDDAWLVSPTGALHRRGIAAWNARPTPLSPGNRVMLVLPGASETASTSAQTAAALINERLPAYLATRLPGDDCTLWTNAHDDTISRHQP